MVEAVDARRPRRGAGFGGWFMSMVIALACVGGIRSCARSCERDASRQYQPAPRHHPASPKPLNKRSAHYFESSAPRSASGDVTGA